MACVVAGSVLPYAESLAVTLTSAELGNAGGIVAWRLDRASAAPTWIGAELRMPHPTPNAVAVISVTAVDRLNRVLAGRSSGFVVEASLDPSRDFEVAAASERLAADGVGETRTVGSPTRFSVMWRVAPPEDVAAVVVSVLTTAAAGVTLHHGGWPVGRVAQTSHGDVAVVRDEDLRTGANVTGGAGSAAVTASWDRAASWFAFAVVLPGVEQATALAPAHITTPSERSQCVCGKRLLQSEMRYFGGSPTSSHPTRSGAYFAASTTAGAWRYVAPAIVEPGGTGPRVVFGAISI